MSGHSKWHRIKRQKAKEDKKRGKLFSKLSRKISVAARMGKNPDKNTELRHAIEEAKKNDMPKENIEKAILRGSGELPEVNYTEITYEGYGPGGIAIFIDAVTDNKNRTTSELRHIFDAHGGKMGSEGCVSYLFSRKGIITVNKKDAPEIQLYNLAIEAGAQDIKEVDDFYEIHTEASDLHRVYRYLKDHDITIEDYELTYIPNTEQPLEGKEAKRLLKLISELEDSDDIQNVYSNFNIPDSIIAEME